MDQVTVFANLLILITLSLIVASNGDRGCVPLEHPSPHDPCIPIELVNKAFAAARQESGLELYTGYHLDRHHEKIDILGHVLTETTRIISRELRLDRHQILHLLPKLDLSQTDVGKFCPAQLQSIICKEFRYRSVSGQCNNVEHPSWGASLVPFANMIPPQHTDGVSSPREAEDGYLPSARLVSSFMHKDTVRHDQLITTMLIAWGQIIDHDITLTADTKDSLTLKEPDCCQADGFHHHNCFPIEIPQDDHFYKYHDRKCMNFLRSFSGVRSGCRLGPRVSFNTISSYLDANFLYGSTPELANYLRVGKFGLLKSLDVFHESGLKPLLPLKTEQPDDGCIRHNSDLFCFLAGDIRVNEQLILTVLHTLFMREHNRIAENLYRVNPHWDDELLYQEARRIVIAIVQHITFNEFLPMVLGRGLMARYGLELQEKGYWNGYDPRVNPTAAEEFITSAFRFGHSLLPHKIERWSHGHRPIDSRPLHTLIRQPYDVYRPGYVDTFIMGLVNQLAQSMDEGVTEEVTTLLFKEPKVDYGMDLAAMNIQRGRDHGVPGYTAYREVCGLRPILEWDDLIGVMKNETVMKYRAIYSSPHDIDLWSGGVSEIPSRDSLLGPTFGCIIAQQFQALRYGDRFWYELPSQPSSFTEEQLEEIRNVKLSNLLCQNSDDIKTIQVYAMILPDGNVNPRVTCHSLEEQNMNFRHWKDLSDIAVEVEQQVQQYSQYENVSQNIPENGENVLTNLYRLPPASKDVIVEHQYVPEIIVDEFPQGLENIQSYGGSNVTSHLSQPQELTIQIQGRQHGVKSTATVKIVERPLVLPPVSRLFPKASPTVPPIKPFPENHPFPGMDGIFSPNPGYLVRQQFFTPRGVPPPPTQMKMFRAGK